MDSRANAWDWEIDQADVVLSSTEIWRRRSVSRRLKVQTVHPRPVRPRAVLNTEFGACLKSQGPKGGGTVYPAQATRSSHVINPSLPRMHSRTRECTTVVQSATPRAMRQLYISHISFTRLQPRQEPSGRKTTDARGCGTIGQILYAVFLPDLAHPASLLHRGGKAGL